MLVSARAGACLVGMALVGTVLSYAHGAWRERKRQRDADDLFADNAVGERLLFPGEVRARLRARCVALHDGSALTRLCHFATCWP